MAYSFETVNLVNLNEVLTIISNSIKEKKQFDKVSVIAYSRLNKEAYTKTH